jgi:hypothetical protein
MTDATTDEKALQAEIDAARIKITDTKQLYKWVCSILFFKYGITPTTNRLYQLVRKGSMQTVTTSLGAFWEDLRERSRLKIDHPGVPEDLTGATGDMVQAIWGKANIQAKAFYEAAAAEAISKVEAANNAQLAAEKDRDDTKGTVDRLQTKLAAIESDLNAAVYTVEAERRAHGATSARLEESRAEVLSLRNSVAEARRDFANELEKARASTRVAEEREAAAERRMLLELDRERTMRLDAERATTQLRNEITAASQQAASRSEAAAAENGQLKGQLAAAEQIAERYGAQIASMRLEASDLMVEVARGRVEATATLERLAELQTELATTRAGKPRSSKVRKVLPSTGEA